MTPPIPFRQALANEPLLNYLDRVVRNLYSDSLCSPIPAAPQSGITIAPHFEGKDIIGDPISAGFSLVATDDHGLRTLERIAESVRANGKEIGVGSQVAYRGRRYEIELGKITQLYR